MNIHIHMKKHHRIKFLALALMALLTTTAHAATTLNSDAALTALKDGNARYVAGKSTHPNLDAARRTAVAKGQNPFVTVLTCSDSRVPAELVFDQGLGDVFTVRVAGNVSDTDEVGTIEYGVGHLNTPLLVIMGHTSCGAVKAVLEGAQVHGSIPALVDNIAPAIANTKAANPSAGVATLLGEAVKANVWVSIDDVFKRSSEVRDLVKAGKLKVLGAVYDLESGNVNWLGAHPEQARLLAYTEGAAHGTTDAHAATDSTHAATASEHGAVDSHAAPASGAAASHGATASTHAPEAETGGSNTSLILLGLGIAIGLLGLAGGTFYATRRSTLKTRILANSALLLALLLGVSGIAWYEFQKIGHNLDSIAQHDLPILNNLADVEAKTLQQALDLEKFSSSGGNARFAADFDRLAVEVVHELEAAKTEIGHALKNAADPEARREYQKMLEEVNTLVKENHEFDQNGDAYMAAMKAGQKQKAAQLKELLDREGHQMHTEITNLVNEVQAVAQHEAVQAQSAKAEGQVMLLIISLASLVIGILFAFFTARDITNRLRTVSDALQAGADQTAAASAQVASASQQLAEGASEQAAALEETSASLEEMTSMVKRNAEAAGKAKVIAGETRIAADTGSTDMAEMKTAMSEIKISSSEVAKIVKDIDEIAFQTNILALNAAVEAARAGEAGAGFAVVADEVRNLAQRSAASAKQTAAKIEDAIAKSERGVQISNKVAVSFEQIATKTREVDNYVAEIAAASQEQAQGVSQVNVAISQMDKVTQSNAATSEESAAAAEELNAQAASVKESVQTLQQLVGGTSQQGTTGVSRSAAAPKPVRVAKPTPRVRASTGPAAGGNNGSSNGARSDLPLPAEADFKNF